MSVVSVTTKGQVTIPVAVRRTLGIHPGSKVTFTTKKGVALLELAKSKPGSTLASGAAMLRARSKRQRSLLNFDPAALLKNK